MQIYVEVTGLCNYRLQEPVYHIWVEEESAMSSTKRVTTSIVAELQQLLE